MKAWLGFLGQEALPPLEARLALSEERPAQAALEAGAPIQHLATPRMKPRRLAAVEQREKPLDGRPLVPQLATVRQASAAPADDPLMTPQNPRPPAATRADEERPRPAVGKFSEDDSDVSPRFPIEGEADGGCLSGDEALSSKP